jgi:hypothetical protein
MIQSGQPPESELDRVEVPELDVGLDRVIVSVFKVDIATTYDELENALWIDDALTPQTIRLALNKAEENARQAHRLYVAAKLAHETFEISCKRVEAELRQSALDRLNAEKDAGLNRKQITESDVDSMMAALYPDEHQAIHQRRNRAKLTIEHLKRLADLWQSRCRSLTSLNNN